MAASFIWVRISCSSFAQGCYPHGAWRCVQRGWHKHKLWKRTVFQVLHLQSRNFNLFQDHNCWHTCTGCLSYCASETNITTRKSRSKNQNCATESSNYKTSINYTHMYTNMHKWWDPEIKVGGPQVMHQDASLIKYFNESFLKTWVNSFSTVLDNMLFCFISQ